MKFALGFVLFFSISSQALIGLPPDTCQALRAVAESMRDQAKTGVPAGDTEIMAGQQCGGHIPWAKGAEELSRYWEACAAKFDQAYRDNCENN